MIVFYHYFCISQNNKSQMYNKFIFLALMVCSVFAHSQSGNYDSVKYYSKLAITSLDFDRDKSIPYINKALVFAEKTEDPEVLSDILIKKGHIEYFSDKVDESFLTLRKASMQEYTKQNPYFQARIKIIRADNYNRLGLDSLSLKESKDVLKLLSYKTKDVKEQSMLLRSLGRLADYYESHKDKPKYEKYFSDYEHLLKNLNRKDFIPEFEVFYFNKSTLLLEKKLYDSAYHYLKLGEAFEHSLGNKTLPYYYYYAFGEYYNSIKDYKLALKYYDKCIKHIENSKFPNEDFLNAFLKAADLSGKLGNKEQQIKYLDTYSKIKEKLTKSKYEGALNNALHNLVQEKEASFMSVRNKIIFGLVILFCLVLVLVFYIKKIQKKRDLLRVENEKQMSEKQEMVSAIERERQLSKQNSKEALENILELARKNDPSFYVKFSTLFPDFQKKLTTVSPTLMPSELELLAYIFLNISTKDLADSTFKSVRTIQNRKYALRKKLNIDSTIDFHIWIKNIVNDSGFN